MLQFNTIFCTASAKFTSRLWWKLSIPLSTNAAVVSDTASKLQKVRKNIEAETPKPRTDFKWLKTKVCNFLRTKAVDTMNIQKAKSVKEIMKITQTSLLSPEDNATIKEIVDTWIADNNKILESISNNQGPSSPESTDLDNIFFDMDSQYHKLSTSGLVTEISRLTESKNRNVPVLRYLFENILKYNNVLHPAQCSSLMYCMSRLNFSDERLLKKICSDLEQNNFPDKQIHILKLLSILSSMASIRYKNDNFLNKICNRIVDFKDVISQGQIIKLLQSLAILGFESEATDNVINKYMPKLINSTEGIKYLHLVWALIIFNKANSNCISKLFHDRLVKKVISEEYCSPAVKLKLLNINAYAKYILKNYSGPFLSDTMTPVVKNPSKQKKLYIEKLEDTLKNIVPSASYFKINVNTNMGFCLDAELYLDTNGRPVCADSVEGDYKKIGIMMLDYYDLSLGSFEPLGLYKLYTRLLEACQYEVLYVPYHHFDVEDKTEKRIMYLRSRLWNKYKNDLF